MLEVEYLNGLQNLKQTILNCTYQNITNQQIFNYKIQTNFDSAKVQFRNDRIQLKEFRFQCVDNGEQDRIYRCRNRRKVDDNQIFDHKNEEQQENLNIQQLIDNITIVKNAKDGHFYITFEDDQQIYTQLQQILPNLFFDGNSKKIIISDQYYDILFQKLRQMFSQIDFENQNICSQHQDLKVEYKKVKSQIISSSTSPSPQIHYTQRAQSKSLQLDINLINESENNRNIGGLSSQAFIYEDKDLKANQTQPRQVGNQYDYIENIYLSKIKQFMKILAIIVENNWLQYVMTQINNEKEDEHHFIKPIESETNSLIDHESISIACQLETKSDRISEIIINEKQKINCQLSDNNSSIISSQSMINPSTASTNFYKINEDSRYDRIYFPKRLKERAGFDFKYKVSNVWEEQIKFQSSSDTSDSECDKSDQSDYMSSDNLNSTNRFDNIIKYVFSYDMNYEYNQFMMMSPMSRLSGDNQDSQDNQNLIEYFDFYNPYTQYQYSQMTSSINSQNSYPTIQHLDQQQNNFQQAQSQLNSQTPQKLQHFSSKSIKSNNGQGFQQNNNQQKHQSGQKQQYQRAQKLAQQQQYYQQQQEEIFQDNYNQNNLHQPNQNQNNQGTHFINDQNSQTFQFNQNNNTNNEDQLSNQLYQPQRYNNNFFPDDLQPSMLNQINNHCRGNSSSSTQSQYSNFVKQNDNIQGMQQQTGFNILPSPQSINNSNINFQTSQIPQNQYQQHQQSLYNQKKQQQQYQQNIYNSNKKQVKETNITNNKINSNSSFNSSVSDHNFNHQTNNSYNSINTIYLQQQSQQRPHKKIKGVQIMNQQNQKQNSNYKYNKSNQHPQDTIHKSYKQNNNNYYLPQTQSPLSAISLDDYFIFSDRNSNSSTSTYQNNHFEDIQNYNQSNNYSTGNNYSNYNQQNGNFNPQLTQKNLKNLIQQQNAARREQNTVQNQQYKQKYAQQRQTNMSQLNNNNQQQDNNQIFNNNFNKSNSQSTSSQCCDKNCCCNQNYYNNQQNQINNYNYNNQTNNQQQNQRYNTEINNNQQNMYSNNSNDNMYFNHQNQNSNGNKIKKRKQQNTMNDQNIGQNMNNMQNSNNNNQIYAMNNMNQNNPMFQNTNINNTPIYEEYQYNENNDGQFENYSDSDNDMYYNNINRNVNNNYQYSQYSGSNKTSKDSKRNNNYIKQQGRSYQNNQKPYYQNTQNIQNFINFTDMNNNNN